MELAGQTDLSASPESIFLSHFFEWSCMLRMRATVFILLASHLHIPLSNKGRDVMRKEP